MMFTADVTTRGFISKLLLSCSISALLLALLIKFTLSSAEPAVWSSLLSALGSVSGSFILLYIIASLVRTMLQTFRYRLLLRTSEETVPSLFHILLVTLSRNMFVDMLPARLGELSYIAMLNRGYRVRGQSCVSSLAISFVFDLIALGILIALLAVVQLLGGVRSAAAQDCMNARLELRRRERLADMVVGAGIQRRHLVGAAVACGQHDDRDGPVPVVRP